MKTRKATLDENRATLKPRAGKPPSWALGAAWFDVTPPDAISGFHVGLNLDVDDEPDLRVMTVDYVGAWISLTKAPAKASVTWYTNRLSEPVNEHTFTGKRIEGYEATTAKRWPEPEELLTRSILRKHGKISRGLAKA